LIPVCAAIGGILDALGDLGGAGLALATDSAGFANGNRAAPQSRRHCKQLGQACGGIEALGLGRDYQVAVV